MKITKEKILAAICTLVACIVLANVSVPSAKEIEEVPPEERASSYRMAAGSVKPRLSPDGPYSARRDPFQAKDPWAESAPALLAVPPVQLSPRALDGVSTPIGEAPLLLERDPKEQP